MNHGDSAVARHDRMVREERDQAERLRSDRGGEPDLWKPHASRFGASGHHEEHSAVPALGRLVASSWRVIDVGAGGGRITIPLARQVREMVAVEPSPSMRAVLASQAREQGVDNITIVPDAWEAADVAPAELVYAANVTYGIMEIAPFLRKMDVRATRIAALVAFADPPQHRIAPFWRFVYGEERLRLPCRAELVDVLRELGAAPQLIYLPPHEPQPFGTREAAREELRRRLYIGHGTALESRLDAAIDALTVERDGVLWSRDERPNERSVIWWEPGHLASGT